MFARAICLRLLVQTMRLAASRTFWMAGSKRPIKTAMMAITTSSSISVKAVRRRMADLLSGIGGGLPGKGLMDLEVKAVLAIGRDLGRENRLTVVLGLDAILVD